MKKAILLISCLVSCSLLAGCNNSSTETPSTSQDTNYHIVKFMYNSGFKPGETYKNVVVLDNQTLEKPADPNVQGYVFQGWYTNASCKDEYEYLRWGLQIDSDLTLYAKWSMFRTSPLDLKVERFQNVIKNMSSNVYKVNQNLAAEVAYPTLSETIFGVKDKYVFNRYSDITIKDYYQIDEDGGESYYGQEQFSYDTRYFYAKYHDFEDPSENESSQSVFDEKKIEKVMGIGFANFYSSCEETILKNYDKPKTDKYTFDYTFEGNYTELCEIKNGTYSFKEGYALSQYSDSVGTYVTYQYVYEFKLAITNGKIKAADVEMEYLMALGEDEIYEYVLEQSQYDFYYNDGVYPEYTGTRF